MINGGAAPAAADGAGASGGSGSGGDGAAAAVGAAAGAGAASAEAKRPKRKLGCIFSGVPDAELKKVRAFTRSAALLGEQLPLAACVSHGLQ